MKDGLRFLLAALMIGAGTLHFTKTRVYLRMMPPWLPAHLQLVWISGVAEVLCGVGLLVPFARSFSAWATIALFVAVFPANVHMALNHIGLSPNKPVAPWILWARLPLQALLIAWAYWYT